MFLSDQSPKEEFSIISKCKLLYWKTPLLCITNQWWTHNIKEYCRMFAWSYLENNKNIDDKVLFLADGSSYTSDIDIINDIKDLANKETIDSMIAEYLWIYSRLMTIKNSDSSIDTRYAELQDVIEDIIISRYEYPQEIRHCDQYYLSDIQPFVAMDKLIDTLQRKIKMSLL